MKPSTKAKRKSQRLTDQPPSYRADITTRSCLLPTVTEQTIVKGTQLASLTASASAAQAPTYYFAITNANVGTGFYDQYKYLAVRFTIRPQQNALGLTTNTTTTLVPIYCVIDYDDDTALASSSAAGAYSNCVVIEPGQSCSRLFKPHLAIAAYSGAFTSYVNASNQWIDSASNAVRHYGVKLYIPAATAAQTQLQTWDIVIEHYFAMRTAI